MNLIAEVRYHVHDQVKKMFVERVAVLFLDNIVLSNSKYRVQKTYMDAKTYTVVGEAHQVGCARGLIPCCNRCAIVCFCYIFNCLES